MSEEMTLDGGILGSLPSSEYGWFLATLWVWFVFAYIFWIHYFPTLKLLFQYVTSDLVGLKYWIIYKLARFGSGMMEFSAIPRMDPTFTINWEPYNANSDEVV